MKGDDDMLMAKLFTNGSSQAVRLPKDCRFNGTEVCVNRVGSSVILVPKEKAWETFLQGIDGFDDDYFEIMEHRHETEGEQRGRAKL